MTSSEVAALVREQIGDQWDRWTSHDLDLRESVLEHPTKETFISTTREGDVELDLWLVVEEAPAERSGYIVVFDEETGGFGLAVRDTSGRKIYVGEYGDLWATLEGM